MPGPTGAKRESAEASKVTGQEKTKSAEAPKSPAEAKDKTAEEPELESVGLPKILSPPPEPELPKVTKVHGITPKRRRMASVLDNVLESVRAPTPASAKEAAEVTTTRVEVKAGPSVPIETEPVEPRQNIEQGHLDAALVLEEEDAPKKVESPTPEESTEELDFIIRHASGKKLSEEEIAEAKHYSKELKYPKGSLVYNGTDEDDFLYCLPDNKELSICREMERNMGFPKLELVSLQCRRMTLQTTSLITV
jgi:hypothetical protein